VKEDASSPEDPIKIRNSTKICNINQQYNRHCFRQRSPILLAMFQFYIYKFCMFRVLFQETSIFSSCFMMTRIIRLLKENSLSIISILLRIYPFLRIIYMYVFVFLLFLLYVCFFRSFIFFHLTTIYSFLFSKGEKNINIDLDLFCSY